MFSEIDLDFHPPVSQCSISIDNINSHRECSNPVTKTTATTSFLVFWLFSQFLCSPHIVQLWQYKCTSTGWTECLFDI